MRDAVTAALDVLGLLGLAAGVFFALLPFIGYASVGVASLVVLGVSAYWQTRRPSPDDGTRP